MKKCLIKNVSLFSLLSRFRESSELWFKIVEEEVSPNIHNQFNSFNGSLYSIPHELHDKVSDKLIAYELQQNKS